MKEEEKEAGRGGGGRMERGGWGQWEELKEYGSGGGVE